MSASGGALRQVAAVFGVEFQDEQLRRGTASISGAVGLVRSFVGLLAANEVIGAIRGFVHEFGEAASQLVDTSGRLGATTDQLQEMQHAAGLSGVRAEQLNEALNKLQLSASMARSGSGNAAEAFRALGVNVRDASGHVRPVSDLMDDVAAGMGRVGDHARQAEIAQQLFGRAGTRLLPILHTGAGGLAELRGELAQLGGGISRDAIEAADDLGDNMDRWHVASRSLQSSLAVQLLPALTTLVTWVTRGVTWLARLSQGSDVLKRGFVALAVVAAARLAPAILSAASAVGRFLLRAIPIAMIVLIVDDLIALFRGGQSVIGDFINAMFGMGTAEAFVRRMTEAWQGLRLAVLDAWDAIQEFRGNAAVSGSTRERRDREAQHNAEIERNRAAHIRNMTRIQEQMGREGVQPGQSGLTTEDTSNQALVGHVAFQLRQGQQLANAIRIARAQLRAEGITPQQVAALRGIDIARTPAPPGGTGRAAAPARGTTVTRTTHVGPTTVQVNGAGNPTAVANEVARVLRARERAQADADHPLPQRGTTDAGT